MEDRIVSAKEWYPSDTLRSEYLPCVLSSLKDIAFNPQKNEWCMEYSAYMSCDDLFGIDREVDWFISATYSEGLVVKDYGDYIDMHEREAYAARSEWVSRLSLEELLACIAIHFRRDHYCNGSLISESIPSGAMLRLMEELEKRMRVDFSPSTDGK